MSPRSARDPELRPRLRDGNEQSSAPSADKLFGPAKYGGRETWFPTAANAADLCRALADRQQLLDLALKQISKLDQDVAQLTLAVAQERQYAYYDALTGLPNRRLLLDRFNQAVAHGSRQHKQMALLFLDLDGFKSINDSLGHETGDELLKQVAGRLVTCIRTSDTVCRYGGDEFVILLAEIQSQKSALAAAKKIRACLARPYALYENEVQVTASIGIAVYPIDGAGYADLIERSDTAMYCDKARNPATSGAAAHTHS